MSEDFSRTESRIFGALSPVDDFLLNPLIQDHSGTAPETSRNTLGTNQGTNEDNSQSDPHPEASVSRNQTTQNSGPDDTYKTILPQQFFSVPVASVICSRWGHLQSVYVSLFKNFFTKTNESGRLSEPIYSNFNPRGDLLHQIQLVMSFEEFAKRFLEISAR